MTLKDISVEFDVCISTVKKTLIKAGIPFRKVGNTIDFDDSQKPNIEVAMKGVKRRKKQTKECNLIDNPLHGSCSNEELDAVDRSVRSINDASLALSKTKTITSQSYSRIACAFKEIFAELEKKYE